MSPITFNRHGADDRLLPNFAALESHVVAAIARQHRKIPPRAFPPPSSWALLVVVLIVLVRLETRLESRTWKRNPRMGLFSSSIFRRKDITHLIGEMDDGERLNRRLGPVRLMGLGIGATIGTGLYVQTGFVANQVAGPSIILSLLLAAVGCGFAAFCYSELASMVPVAGSAYTYAYATMGELVAWIIGWDLILEYAIASGAVAAGWSNYLGAFLHNVFHIQIDPRLGQRPGTTTSDRASSS